MTTLAAIRRASALQARGKPHVTVPRVVAVPVCTLCGLATSAPGVCAGRQGKVMSRAGLGHTSSQPVTNRAARRQRVIRANDGRIIGRTYPREAWLRSYSRVMLLRRAAAHDRARLNRLDANGRIRVITANDTARARMIRRLAHPGRLRAEAYETAWATARAAKQSAFEQALAQADATIDLMVRRRRFARKTAA